MASLDEFYDDFADNIASDIENEIDDEFIDDYIDYEDGSFDEDTFEYDIESKLEEMADEDIGNFAESYCTYTEDCVDIVEELGDVDFFGMAVQLLLENADLSEIRDRAKTNVDMEALKEKARAYSEKIKKQIAEEEEEDEEQGITQWHSMIQTILN